MKLRVFFLSLALAVCGNSFAAQAVSESAAIIPAVTNMQVAAVANGNGVSLNVAGYVGALLHIKSSVAMSGGTTVNFEASVDNVTWTAIYASTVGTTTTGTTTTADGDYALGVAGFTSVRARISAYSAGTTTITGYVTPVTPAPSVAGSAVTCSSCATSALQTTGNTTLSTIATNTTNIGTPLQAATALPAGTNLLGGVNLVPATTGGWLVATGSATSTAAAVKASAGQIGGWFLGNTTAAVCYLQIWNLGTGSVTVGTTAPTMSIMLPASASANVAIPSGIAFGTAITVASTTTRAGSSSCGIDYNIWYF